jgi:clan AA aspartic protease
MQQLGHVKATIKVSNPTKADLKPIEITCLVDSGATYLCLPQHVATYLELKELQKREVILTNGQSQLVPCVGPLKVEFENRLCFVGAMVRGDQPLLGAIPM